MADLLLALDQGTTSTRAVLFQAPDLVPLAEARRDLPQHFPQPGWVEHEPEDLVAHSLAVLREVVDRAGCRPADIAAIGITNQRETTLVWDRATGRAAHRAIVWQDRRTAEACAALRPYAATIARHTGLVPDPYFSATKLAWLLDPMSEGHIPEGRDRAARGELLFGTVDSFLLWHLTDGRVHATDATNASRTMLYDIAAGRWDPGLLELFGVPAAMLPEVRDSAGRFGVTRALGGETPILGVAGDQQAAMAGQACFRPGLAKATFGTGCFLLLHTGARPVPSRHRMLTTVALQLRGERTYALEGAVFVAGAAVQWLRDGLGLLGSAAESGELAAQADPDGEALLVPAFTGLGAPYWDPAARGALFNLTRATSRADLARAALDGVAHQTADLVEAMRADLGPRGGEADVLRVDGGMAASDWTMQRVADLLAAPVDRPAYRETTALGAAYLAGLEAGLCAPPPGASGPVAGGAALRAGDGRGGTGAAPGGMGGCGAADAEPGAAAVTQPSPLIAFYRGEAPDDRGRWLADIQAWSDGQLEAVHDYVQWLFPLPERSAFNPDAPLLSAADVAAFRDSAELRARLLASYRRMLAFYGFALDEAGETPSVVPAADFAGQARNWLRPGNHNLLRLTRILRCLTLLGLETQARALLACLERVADGVGAVTLRYWRDAVRSDAAPG